MSFKKIDRNKITKSALSQNSFSIRYRFLWGKTHSNNKIFNKKIPPYTYSMKVVE